MSRAATRGSSWSGKPRSLHGPPLQKDLKASFDPIFCDSPSTEELCNLLGNLSQSQSEEDISPVTLESIRRAYERIKDDIVKTPVDSLIVDDTIEKPCRAKIHLKLENLQRTRSFKLRGALNKIRTLPKGSTVVCASAGNHAQGVALGARLCGMNAIIYMPETAPISKIKSTQNYGAKIVQFGSAFDDALKKCKEDLSKNPDWIFIPPFDDNLVIAGQGTIGLEILEQIPNVDTVVIQVGGGGLAAGISVCLKTLKPSIRIICVQAEIRSNCFQKFHQAKGKVDIPENVPFVGVPLGDGIAVLVPGEKTLPIIRKYVDDFVTVSEDEIAQGMAFLAEKAKVVCEGSGAATVAAVLNEKFHYLDNENIVCIVSGGNVDLGVLANCVERGLYLSQSRVGFSVTLPLGTRPFMNMLQVVMESGLEVVNANAESSATCTANHARYFVTVNVPRVEGLATLRQAFQREGWLINEATVAPVDK